MSSLPRMGLSRLASAFIAATAMFLLVPGMAHAAIDSHILITGNGSGKVVGVEPTPGKPPLEIDCSYDGSSKSGTCDTESHKSGEGTEEEAPFKSLSVNHEAAPGSKFGGWKVTKGTPVGCTQNSPGAGSCAVILSGEIVIEAIFEAVPGPPLTVQKTGTGDGTLTSSPPGIDCEPGCEEETAEFEEGEAVTLTAAPDADSIFSGWRGADAETAGCDESGESVICEVEMTAPMEIEAEFTATNVHISIEGGGSGTVLSSTEEESAELVGEPLIDCHYTSPGPETGICDNVNGASLGGALPGTALEQQADEGSVFVEWIVEEGSVGLGCEPGEVNCNVFFPEPGIKVTAVFERTPHTLTIEPSGEGSVDAVPPPGPVAGEISGCEEGGGECSAEYREGDTVTLEATPGEHKVVEWTGCDSAIGDVCEVEIPAEDVTVQAEFVAAPQGTLTVEPTGAGSVDAEESPAPSAGEITGCEEGGGECLAEYFQGETVTLVATPGEHQEVAWTGCDSEPTSDECEVEVDGAAVSVQADFTQITHTLGVTAAGTGSGSVECKIDGGAAGPCSGPIDEGAEVEVIATAAAHSTFDGFSEGTGSASACATSPCVIGELLTDSTLKATFTQITHTLGVTAAGTGSGSVECKIDGGAAGPCSGPIDEGAEVEVIATAAAHSTFDGFSEGTGSASACATSPCVIGELLTDSTLKATFTQITHELTVAPTGEGSVDGGPIAGCEEGGGTCAGAVDEGDTVTLTATPDEHRETVWTSGCDNVPSANECEVEVDEDRTVEVEFVLIERTLTINQSGTGSGVVECEVEESGVEEPCQPTYPDGTDVIVIAFEGPNSEFVEWTGAGDCDEVFEIECEVTMDEDKTVEVVFDLEPEEEEDGGGGGGDNGGGPTPPPAPPLPPQTCLTNPALCKPGLLIANPAAQVKGNKALLKVRCRGEQGARCRSVLKLIARVKVNGKKRNIVVGESRYNLPTNSAVRILRAKLTGKGLKLVRRAGQRGLKVKLTGKGVRNRVVKLKQQGGGKKKRKGRRAGRS